MVIRNCQKLILELSQLEKKIQKFEKIFESLVPENERHELLKKVLEEYVKTRK